MNYSFDRPLFETIGTEGGSADDGIHVGAITKSKPDKFFFRTRALSTGRVFTADDTVTGVSLVDVSAAANSDAAADVQMFPASPTVGDRIIFALPAAQPNTGYDIVLSGASSGITYAFDYWSTTDNAWKTLAVTTSGSFLGAAGAHSLTFTTPADMGGRPFDLVGGGSFFGKALSLRITAISSPVSPVATRIYPLGADFQNLDISTFYDDLNTTQTNLFAHKGTEQCFVDADKSFGFELIYETAETNTTFKFGHPDPTTGLFTPFAEFQDDSNAFALSNSKTHAPHRLTASASNAVAATAQAIIGSGYVEKTINAVPTASTGRTSIGLDDATAGNIKYQLRNDFTGGNPRLTVYEDNVLKYTHTVNTPASAKLRVMRFEGEVVYSLNGRTIYKSATASAGNVFGRFGATDNAAIVGGIKLIDFNMRLATPVALTFVSVTSFTSTTESAVTEQLLAVRTLRFVPPATFIPLTAAQSPVGVAGYHYCIQHDTAGIPGVQSMLGRILPMTGPGVIGDVIEGPATFTRVNAGFADGGTIKTESKMLVINGATGEFQKITVPAGATQFTQDISIAYADANELLIAQITGDKTSDVGFGSFIALQG